MKKNKLKKSNFGTELSCKDTLKTINNISGNILSIGKINKICRDLHVK